MESAVDVCAVERHHLDVVVFAAGVQYHRFSDVDDAVGDAP